MCICDLTYLHEALQYDHILIHAIEISHKSKSIKNIMNTNDTINFHEPLQIVWIASPNMGNCTSHSRMCRKEINDEIMNDSQKFPIPCKV